MKCGSNSECLENALQELRENMLAIFGSFYTGASKLST